jgi:hypothetical protein
MWIVEPLWGYSALGGNRKQQRSDTTSQNVNGAKVFLLKEHGD